MKKALIFFFSGTGNTKIVAGDIEKELQNHEYETTLYNIRVPFKEIPDLSEFDLFGFGYPIHAFNSPQFFLKFVKKLGKVENKKAFIFKVSGEPFHFNNASSFSLSRVLRKKGFNVIADEHFLMPYYIVFKYPSEIAKHMVLHSEKLAKVLVKEIITDKTKRRRYYPWTILFMYISRIQWLGAKINGPLIHVKKDKCIGCKKCVLECPAKNIKMVGEYPKFDHKCTMCMNCVAVCPYDAVRPGFLNGWRVNGIYPYEKLVKDENVKDVDLSNRKTGYFKLFKKYYRKTNERFKEIKEKD